MYGSFSNPYCLALQNLIVDGLSFGIKFIIYPILNYCNAPLEKYYF
jgi:hypothetical protein